MDPIKKAFGLEDTLKRTSSGVQKFKRLRIGNKKIDIPTFDIRKAEDDFPKKRK